jgi:hypothetical protein
LNKKLEEKKNYFIFMKNFIFPFRLFPLLIFIIFLFQIVENTKPKYEYDSNYHGRKGIPIVHAHYELNEENIDMLAKSNPPEVIQALREKLRRQKKPSRLLKMEGISDDTSDKKMENKIQEQNEYEEENINLDEKIQENENIIQIDDDERQKKEKEKEENKKEKKQKNININHDDDELKKKKRNKYNQ